MRHYHIELFYSQGEGNIHKLCQRAHPHCQTFLLFFPLKFYQIPPLIDIVNGRPRS